MNVPLGRVNADAGSCTASDNGLYLAYVLARDVNSCYRVGGKSRVGIDAVSVVGDQRNEVER